MAHYLFYAKLKPIVGKFRKNKDNSITFSEVDMVTKVPKEIWTCSNPVIGRKNVFQNYYGDRIQLTIPVKL